MASDTTCAHGMWSGYRSYQCGKPGKVEHEGRWFCGVHNPIAKAKRVEARHAKWDVERAAREASYATAKAIIAQIGGGRPRLNDGDVYDVLLTQDECLSLQGNCGTCAHANHDDAGDPALTVCTLAGGFYNGKLMQMSARCADWAKP